MQDGNTIHVKMYYYRVAEGAAPRERKSDEKQALRLRQLLFSVIKRQLTMTNCCRKKKQFPDLMDFFQFLPNRPRFCYSKSKPGVPTH